MIGSRRCPNERGAVIVIVTIMMVVLMALMALVVDVGLLYGERRGLQRAADLAALSGVQVILDDPTLAEDTAKQYIEKNPTPHHQGSYDVSRGDFVRAYPLATTSGCAFQAPQQYDCVEARVKVPKFNFFFGPLLGIDKTSVQASARAIIGTAAPEGEKLVPWLIIDCPDAYSPDLEKPRGYVDEQVAAADLRAIMDTTNVASDGTPICPYRFSDVYSTPNFEELFVSTEGVSAGNFQAADLNLAPPGGTCPATPTSWFEGSATQNYFDFLGGYNTEDVPCVIGPGARLNSLPGFRPEPTERAVTDTRGIDSNCMNPTRFGQTFGEDGDGDGWVTIIDSTNPCLMALLIVVFADDNNAALKTSTPGDIIAMQHPDELPACWPACQPTPAQNDDFDKALWRFSDLRQGSSRVLIVRRVAFFYVTAIGSNKTSYTGLFLRAIDPAAQLVAPANPDSGVLATRLIP
jgi:hypothetical protein